MHREASMNTNSEPSGQPLKPALSQKAPAFSREFISSVARWESGGRFHEDPAVDLTSEKRQLPADVHKRLSRVRLRHRGSLFAFILVYYGVQILSLHILSKSSKAVVVALLFCTSVIALACLILLVRRTDRFCRELGLVCPNCGKTLYQPKGSASLAAGKCPHCEETVFAPRNPGTL